MATRTIMVDDLDGSEATDTLEFSWGADDYTIDLNDANATEFREMMALYVAHATKKAAPVVLEPRKRAPKGTGITSTAKRSPEELAKIRSWATEHGHNVSPKGRIAGTVLAAYDSAIQEAKEDEQAEAKVIANVKAVSDA